MKSGWRSAGSYAGRMAVVAAVIGGVSLLLIGIVVVVLMFVVDGVSKPYAEQGNNAPNAEAVTPSNPQFRNQVVVGIAACLAGQQCASNDPAHDADQWVADTTQVDGQSFSGGDTEQWRRWGLALTRNGSFQADSVGLVRGEGPGVDVVDVIDVQGQLWRCSAEWSADKLTSWSCAPSRSEDEP